MKRIISLFTILCCVLTFVSIPAMAEENAQSTVVTFSDDFQSETDNVPDNWQLFKETSKGVMTVETDATSGNKFLRVNPTANWASGVNVPGAVTKPGKVNVPTDGGIVVVKMKIRSSIISASTQQNVKLSTYDVPVANTNLLFATRDYGDTKDIFCFPTTADNAVSPSTYKLADNTWYDVTAMVDFSADKAYYVVGNKTNGYARFSVNIAGSTLASLDAVTSVTLIMDQVSPNNYTDIDNVSVNYLPEAKNFYDNFETEADTTPDNWSVAATSASTTATVKEENGNKYLRLEATAQRWSSALPSVVTNDDEVKVPLTDKPVLIKYKTRLATDSSSKVQFVTRLSIPGGASATTEVTSNEYQPFTIRTADGKTNLYYYTSNTWPSACSTITFKKDVWYDIYALIDPRTSTVKYTVGNDADGYVVFNGAKMEKVGLASLDVIDNLSTTIWYANAGAYMDLDDVYIGYPEDYADYLPEVLSFEDTFENADVNSDAANWIDRAGVSTVKVMADENGNKFARVTKLANTQGVPQVATKDGLINIPWNNEDNKGIVIEAKVRQQNTNYRSLLMVNAPYLPTATELGQNYGTPFYIHTSDLKGYFMPGYKSANIAAVTLGEWVDYRAVIIPGETQTEIRHYFNDVHAQTTYTSASTMPELFNPDSLYKLSFAWRSSGNDETITTEGYMDFDDIRVYELKDFMYDIKITDGDGANLEEIKNGTVNVNASIVNNGIGRTMDVFAALYTKDENGNWKLTEVKAVENADGNEYLYAYAWRKGEASLSLNVTDAENQMVKVFVWHRTADLDGDPTSFETSLRLQAVCPPYVID